jgi:hypothetical protein
VLNKLIDVGIQPYLKSGITIGQHTGITIIQIKLSQNNFGYTAMSMMSTMYVTCQIISAFLQHLRCKYFLFVFRQGQVLLWYKVAQHQYPDTWLKQFQMFLNVIEPHCTFVHCSDSHKWSDRGQELKKVKPLKT